MAMWSMACDSPGSPDNQIPPFESCLIPALLPNENVEVKEGLFFAGDLEIVPHGIDSYPLLQHMGNGDLSSIRDILNQAKSLGRPIVRTNAFMDGGENSARLRDEDGTIREEGLVALDRIIAESKDAQVRLLLVLTNNWEDFGGAQAVVDAISFPGESLPKDAFWSERRAVEAQLEYLHEIITRTNSITGSSYANDATIFAWELANEARCDDTNWCKSETLANWAKEMSDELRLGGAAQPIFWGGAGHLGEHGEDLRRIGRDGGVDVLTLHLYLNHTHSDLYLLPKTQRIDEAIQIGAAIIRDRVEVSREVGLPLVIEELGWEPPAASDRDAERAAIYEGWLAVAHEEGVATMPWMIGEEGREDYDGLLIRPDDKHTRDVISCY
ncbi:MAG: cellulase family glycosylhydrolase [Deltaproteobacteria bacterium]|nr:cellulase family glycosylhydrolase [Deltaproteobacteria bacterium]